MSCLAIEVKLNTGASPKKVGLELIRLSGKLGINISANWNGMFDLRVAPSDSEADVKKQFADLDLNVSDWDIVEKQPGKDERDKQWALNLISANVASNFPG